MTSAVGAWVARTVGGGAGLAILVRRGMIDQLPAVTSTLVKLVAWASAAMATKPATAKESDTVLGRIAVASSSCANAPALGRWPARGETSNGRSARRPHDAGGNTAGLPNEPAQQTFKFARRLRYAYGALSLKPQLVAELTRRLRGFLHDGRLHQTADVPAVLWRLQLAGCPAVACCT
jgi:hypothetical protein